VEIRDAPHLRGRPVAVGGMSMISTANYEARRFGVRAAMPGFIGACARSRLVARMEDGGRGALKSSLSASAVPGSRVRERAL
jgi:hypothetical protein